MIEPFVESIRAHGGVYGCRHRLRHRVADDQVFTNIYNP